ncbi:WXG100 family type VII secretion target [Aestuariimicrobium soli]|uniref:WXG100 family type VII secretion target n=1 Tax=Aestuariimicrobium soli TaxID=2035834 RepID=UPI003EBF969C
MSAYATEIPIVKDVREVGEGFSEGVSLSTFTAAANIGVSALGAFLDPLAWVIGQLMEPIYNWIINNVTFVKETLNALLGNPDAVSAVGTCTSQHGDTISTQAKASSEAAQRIREQWEGVASDAMAAVMQMWAVAQESLSMVLKACGVAIEAVATVVDTVKQFIIGLGKELINDLISKAVMSALASFVTFGAAYAAYTAWAAGKVASVAAKFTGLLKKLADWGAGRAAQGSQLQAALQRASQTLGRMQTGFLRQVHLADQASGHASTAQNHASTANDLNGPANAPMSDAPYYQQQQQHHTEQAQHHTNQANQTSPDPVPTSTTTGVGAANDAAQNADQRHDDRNPR